jgi:transcriptional regulator with XRE-family HTH domain
MNGTFRSSTHDALRRLLRQKRRQKDMTQHQLAARMGKYRSFVTAVETGQHRVTVAEFLEFAKALGFDPAAAVRRLTKR